MLRNLKKKLLPAFTKLLISSTALLIYFRRYTQSFLSSQLLWRTGYYWLGLSDSAKPETYAWASGDSVLFTYWHNTHTGEIQLEILLSKKSSLIFFYSIFFYIYTHIYIYIYEPPCDKTNKMLYAHGEDSDQPGHPPSLIRVFAVRSMGS